MTGFWPSSEQRNPLLVLRSVPAVTHCALWSLVLPWGPEASEVLGALASIVKLSTQLRRVVYFDNRAASWNDTYRWFDRSVIEKRCRLYQYALHERKNKPYPSDDETFNYQVPAGLPVWNPGDPIDLHAPRTAPKE